MKAIWNSEVLAQSTQTVEVEGNHYFPMSSLKQEFFKASQKQTTCPWKGVAHYFDVVVDGELNEAAAWFYPSPKSEASQIKNHVAFWKGITVISD
jgi:uncharacterized protein (DUF427 family)